MQVIISHINLDFDGLASMVAAKKIYPKAKIVLPTKQTKSVQRFLALYRDLIPLFSPKQIDWDSVTDVIMVDIASLNRIGEVAELINQEQCHFTIYDHHPKNEITLNTKKIVIEQLGATITLLLREISEKNIEITTFEATIYALGLYTDTGAFTYSNTKAEDLKAGGFLLEKGANLQLVSKFSEPPLHSNEQRLLNALLEQSEEVYISGLTITIAHYQQKDYTGGLSVLARKVLDMTGSDALFLVVEMGNKTFIVGRSISHRISILPLIKLFGGGGHSKAGSAMLKHQSFEEILSTVRESIYDVISPSLTAKDIMSTPVKVISPNTTIHETAKMILRYGHTGFPVVENGQLVGIISRRDIDKASHHGLGHAPVKGYMTKNVVTIKPYMSLEELQEVMINKNVGRLPVIENGQIGGIISRTDVIEALHGEKIRSEDIFSTNVPIKKSLQEEIHTLMSPELTDLLRQIAIIADELSYNVYMIGGIVRDLVIGRKNEDLDIVVEGDAIELAKILSEKFGGSIRSHDTFGTATWKYSSELKVDLTSARTEFYDYPAALPTVERSSLKEDLLRRDFTINAMAIQINKREFGNLIDYFHGYKDIQQKKIKVLYNLSFIEDPTRILRAIRFEIRFGFKMNKQTLELVHSSIDKLSVTSKTRIAHELMLLLNTNQPVEAIIRLDQLGALEYIYKSIYNLESEINRYHKFQKAYSELNGSPNLAWLCYVMLIWKKGDDFRFIKSLVQNTNERLLVEQVEKLCIEDKQLADLDIDFIHSEFQQISSEALLCYAYRADFIDEQLHVITKYIQDRKNIPKLLSGNDLKQLNIKPGPIYSRIMLDIECAFLKHEIATKEDALKRVKEQYC